MTDERTLDIIREVINIGSGEAAVALSSILGSRILIKVPEISILTIPEVEPFIQREMRSLGVYISQDFNGPFRGKALLCYTRDCSRTLLEQLTGQPAVTTHLSEAEESTLQEIGNILMVSCLTTIADMIDGRILFQIPQVTEGVSDTFFAHLVGELNGYDRAVLTKNKLSVQDQEIDGYLFVMLGVSDFERLVERLEKKAASSGFYER